jgi:hypothetical protein
MFLKNCSFENWFKIPCAYIKGMKTPFRGQFSQVRLKSNKSSNWTPSPFLFMSKFEKRQQKRGLI